MKASKKDVGLSFNKPFPSRLRQLLKETNTSQAALASILDVERQAVSYYINGITLPNIEKLQRIAEHFGVSADYLLGLTDVRSVDNDIIAICEYTGLSESAVKALHFRKNLDKEPADYKKQYGYPDNIDEYSWKAANATLMNPTGNIFDLMAVYKRSMQRLIEKAEAEMQEIAALTPEQYKARNKAESENANTNSPAEQAQRDCRLALFEVTEEARSFAEWLARDESDRYKQLQNDLSDLIDHLLNEEYSRSAEQYSKEMQENG